MDKKGYTQFYYAVSNGNIELYHSYIKQIQELILEKKDIPYTLIQDFHSLTLVPPSSYEMDNIFAEASKITSKAIEYFENKSNKRFYDLNGKITVEKYGNKWHQFYSLRSLIWPILINYYQSDGEIINDLKESVRFFYKEIKQFRDTSFGKKHKKEFDHYRICVMSAYIVHLIGFKVSNKKMFVNDDLFQSVKNILKDFDDKKAAK